MGKFLGKTGCGVELFGNSSHVLSKYFDFLVAMTKMKAILSFKQRGFV